MPNPPGAATKLNLHPHPAVHRPAEIQIDASVARPSPGVLVLGFAVTGAIDDLLVPSPAAPVRTDGLWRHTCLEAFLKIADSDAYAEFNFSPSGAWAAYGFSGYREGMTLWGITAPAIELNISSASLALNVRLDLARASLANDAPWRVGLAAVIEEKNGELSYWALTHPTEKPDFHHRSGFVYEL